MEKIEYKELDQVGEEALDVISEAVKFNRWMFDTIQPHCNGKILEIGSGLGNISQFFLDKNYSITLSDIRQGYCNRLKENFEGYKNLDGIELIDLTDPEFDSKYKHLFLCFDTVFALNVVEHIKDDNLALSNCRKLLKTDGTLVILVPSYQTLYNKLDTALDHYRRYNKKSLSKLFVNNDYTITHRQYFNFTGIFAWFISGKMQQNDQIPGGQMKLYNLLVPIFKIIDVLVFRTWGLSTIVVGKK